MADRCIFWQDRGDLVTSISNKIGDKEILLSNIKNNPSLEKIYDVEKINQSIVELERLMKETWDAKECDIVKSDVHFGWRSDTSRRERED